MRTKADFNPNAVKPDFGTRTADYPWPGKPNWIGNKGCTDRACKRGTHLHWEATWKLEAGQLVTWHNTQEEALEWIDSQKTPASEPVALEPYKRFAAIMSPARATVLYTRKAPTVGQKVKIGKIEFTVQFLAKENDSRLQLGDIVLA